VFLMSEVPLYPLFEGKFQPSATSPTHTGIAGERGRARESEGERESGRASERERECAHDGEGERGR